MPSPDPGSDGPSKPRSKAAAAGREGAEPRPLEGELAFEEGDLFALSDPLSRDPQYNERRLVLRRKLLALGKRFLAAEASGLPLECRTSLHNPHAFNHKVVRRIWAYLCRDKKEKTRLRKVLGADLAKDLDAAYRNAYLCVAAEAEALEVSLRIHPDGWYDGQNLVRRVKSEGPKPLLALLNALPGFRLQLADWKGEWRCGELAPEQLEEFFRFYKPGEHALLLERRWPGPRSSPARQALFGSEVPAHLVAELAKLLPVYRYAAWSQESDFLFGS